MDRDTKDAIYRAFRDTERAVEAINGPYREMRAALDGLRELEDAVIDDELSGSCETCGELIWSGDESTNGADVLFCDACLKRWNDDEGPKA